jgi:hypothetical protein
MLPFYRYVNLPGIEQDLSEEALAGHSAAP